MRVRLLVIMALVALMSGTMALAADHDPTADYLLRLPANTQQTVHDLGQPVQYTTVRSTTVVVVGFYQVPEAPKPPGPPPGGGCDGPVITYPTDTDPDVWSPPTNPTGEIPCPPPTQPNFPGDQDPYVDIGAGHGGTNQPWSPP